MGGCGEHHHTVHDDGWTVTSDDGDPDTIVIVRPDGTILDRMPRWQAERRARDPYRRRTLDRLLQLRAELDTRRN